MLAKTYGWKLAIILRMLAKIRRKSSYIITDEIGLLFYVFFFYMWLRIRGLFIHGIQYLKQDYDTFVIVNRQHANMLIILTSTYIKGSLLSKLNRKMEKS
jgi:hypothetical protein